MLSINNLSVYFTGRYLFDNVTFLITERDRAGLVGKNGAGKTTLLRIINGEQQPEGGTVSKPNDLQIGYLPQEIVTTGAGTIFEEALNAFDKVLKLKAESEQISIEIAERTDYESDSYLQLINRLHENEERFRLLGGHEMEGETEKILLGLGFRSGDFGRKLSEFSGGWRMRVELAKLLLRRPGLLLLDEPTNHLDIESIQWLEEYLKSFSGAVIVVSHDRAFLDNVTNRTIEISMGRIYDFKTSYSGYVELRESMREQQQAAYSNQQRQLADIERFIERFRYKATKARQVQSKMKMLDKIERVEVDEMDKSAIHFRFPPAPPSGKVVVEAVSLAKFYGEYRVFSHVDFAIERNDFVAFVGRNGEGKTTLAKILAEGLDHDGECRIGYNVKIGYYAQNQADLLDPERTVFQTIDDVAVGDIRPKVRNILGSFLFTGEDIEKKVKVLSGGEKSRLALAKLLLSPVNLLILDEPTNHLDMISKDILKNALLMFDGTLIVVSHDRDFLQGLTQKVFEFRDGKVKQHIGDIYDFLEKRRIATLDQLGMAAKAVAAGQSNDVSLNKINYEKKRQQEKELRKITSRIEKVEQEIHLLESEIAVIDQKLASPENHVEALADETIYQKYESLKNKLLIAMDSWESLHSELDMFKNGDS
ncbi:ABC-F family ATP-binding cassette domain-containing protein [Lentimicrobium sp.]|uniref:ABC-F family ATP-binding cassette domain-containing protein n=1 Tax=Lentimicrobium sp. TaxID=2034841 RepID=UPI0025DE913D|nr:ABC-F family ATP-binding cassette domain-containing protein [Lentimicrobium sp.]MCO5257427.1 ABC-F family ATP-binding cassette domain-containing protein [Lentimicrobium sp.]HOP13167.1 ABC-F family ATP-binding cassette domain-containing protein [Lentimicrobium sp.]HPF64865.1 ABC-F family ATP-binding cassette domain-containing protein [Lentimicrobium sp.]HPJ61825.1 ABC-F family ATP-binding cassette domain-containing protein [Lentimicrobium sp.]HPR26341.1 ABC-F family ATP-binding cassette doma